MGDNQSKVKRNLSVTTKITRLWGTNPVTQKRDVGNGEASIVQQDGSVFLNVNMEDTEANVDAVIDMLQTYKKERVNNG